MRYWGPDRLGTCLPCSKAKAVVASAPKSRRVLFATSNSKLRGRRLQLPREPTGDRAPPHGLRLLFIERVLEVVYDPHQRLYRRPVARGCMTT